MNAQHEEGFRSYLAAVLATAASPALALAATTDGTVPKNIQSAVIEAELMHQVGKLYDGKVRVTITTPASVEDADNTVATHGALVVIARGALAWDDDDAAAATKKLALDAALSAASGYESRGFYYEGSQDAKDESAWQTVLNINYGIEGPLD